MKEKFRFLSVRVILLLSGLFVGFLLLLGYALYLTMGTPAQMWLFMAAALLIALFFYGGYYGIYKPLEETKRVERQFASGSVLNDLFKIRYPYDLESEQVNQRFLEMLGTRELINVSKKQAEYLALQNQINPHFLYNTLEGIRSEALTLGVDSIAEMTEALATFFRYTISNVDHLVNLEDELANIENYYYIQQFRFGKKLQLSIQYAFSEELDEMEILQYRLPKLTLQPVVENSIFHGIERKIGEGHLIIKISVTDSRLIIKVSDDGLGMEADRVKMLNEKLKSLSLDDVNPDTDRRGGIAIQNVNNRIKLLFGEEYGIHVYSQVEAGTDVEISLPIVKD
ncbi:sensor histidine kinase [Lacrimispora indolis]|uniref:sensor histidine kinase n=1 Tax=Lacrimispora indolis TaxID=69825 RepID=UPI00045E7C21|nr:histidine kinase [Lacrimispora indolis]